MNSTDAISDREEGMPSTPSKTGKSKILMEDMLKRRPSVNFLDRMMSSMPERICGISATWIRQMIPPFLAIISWYTTSLSLSVYNKWLFGKSQKNF
ncbi:hypothetical protein HDV05_001540, partial [Chytridiales sp. JEL 0842]